MQRVGILGGSFDPVHNAHLRIAKSFLKSGLIEKLLVIPAPSPPHKSDLQTSFQHRFEMLKIAFQDWKNVEVSDLEERLPIPSYSIQTIQHLQEKNPETRFYLCLGEDSLSHFHKWYKYKEIIKQITIMVAERPGFDSSTVEKEILEKTIFVDHDPFGISSTEIRESMNDQNGTDKIPVPVLEYIRTYHLYE
tara:strand:- start:89 stop:664 length:576 start_codon:yes stop_codon:yes gene_type:complete